MKRVTQYSASVLLLFFCSVFYGVSQSNQEQYIDSVLTSFQKVEGKQRIQRIADYIRGANFHKTDHKKFKPFLEEAYYWENKHPNAKLLNTIRLGHVNILIAEDNSPEAAKHLQEILHSGEPLTRRDSISTYNFLYGIYNGIHAYSEAWEILRVRDGVLANVPENDRRYTDYQKEIIAGRSMLLYSSKQYEEAVLGFKKQIEFAESIHDLHFLAGSYNNLGLAYINMNQPDSAILNFKLSAAAWTEHLNQLDYISPNDSAFVDLLSGNIASALNLKKQFAEAIPLLLKEIETDLRLDLHRYAVNALNELSVSYIGLGQYQDALAVLNRADKILQHTSSPDGIRSNYEQKIKVFEAMGNTYEALQLYKKLTVFNDSIRTIENNTQTAVMQAVYGVDEKNRELGKEKIRTAEAKAETARQRGLKQTLIIGVALMLLILIILAFNAGQRRKRTNILREKNKQIEQQKATIEEALVEKETLLKEIHHRVKNNLQLISGILELQAVKFDDENVKVIMEEGQSRVRSMALIHQQLYQSDDLGKIDFEEYLIKLVNDIVVAFNNKDLKLETEINVNHLSFDVNVAVPLGLIINELVTNALKHGFDGKSEGKISIKIEADAGDDYTLTVSDNGNGLPENFNPDNTNSLGLRLVKGLSRQLGGSYNFTNGTGTHFIIQFKNSNFN